jgi:AcrR family transcriptional regulator
MKRTAARTRLNAGERREAIIDAALPLFACRGFAGVTTKQLAAACGVSEALLYRHFPSKESLWESLQRSCLRDGAEDSRVRALPPSTSTLVLMVHHLVDKIVIGRGLDEREHKHLKRLILQSVLDDGTFARQLLATGSRQWRDKFVACMKAAERAGDLVPMDVSYELRGWMIHHMAAGVSLYHLPDKPVIDYGVKGEELVDHIVRVALRGIGLTDVAVLAHYNPRAWALVG